MVIFFLVSGCYFVDFIKIIKYKVIFYCWMLVRLLEIYVFFLVYIKFRSNFYYVLIMFIKVKSCLYIYICMCFFYYNIIICLVL